MRKTFISRKKKRINKIIFPVESLTTQSLPPGENDLTYVVEFSFLYIHFF